MATVILDDDSPTSVRWLSWCGARAAAAAQRPFATKCQTAAPSDALWPGDAYLLHSHRRVSNRKSGMYRFKRAQQQSQARNLRHASVRVRYGAYGSWRGYVAARRSFACRTPTVRFAERSNSKFETF